MAPGSGGNLDIQTNAIVLNTSTVTTMGSASLQAQNAVTVNAGLNATANTITILANQDGVGSEGFSQTAGTLLATTNDTPNAVHVTVNTAVGGNGNLALGSISAGTTAGPGGGRVTLLTFDGVIIDEDHSDLTNIVAGNLLFDCIAFGTNADPIETIVSNLEATAVDNISVTNSGHLIVGGINATTGLSAGGTIQIIAQSPLTITENISAAGVIVLTASDGTVDSTTDDLTINAGVTVESTGSSVTLNAGDDVSINATATLNSPPRQLPLTSILLGATTTPLAHESICDGNLSASSIVLNGGDDNDIFDIAPASVNTSIASFVVNGGNGNDSVNFATNLNVGDGSLTTTADAIAVNGTLTTTGTVTLTATSAGITDGNGATVNVVAGSLAATAATGIDLDTTILNLTANITVTGDISIDETDGLTNLNMNAGSGSIALTTGATILDGDTSTDLTADDVTLVVNGNVGATGGGKNSIQTTVNSLSVDTSANDGSQWIAESNDLTAVNLNAGAGTVVLTTGGSFTDGDGATDITASSTNMTVAGPFGSALIVIGVAVDSLRIDSSGSNGSQWVHDADGLTALNLNAGTGDVVLSTGGATSDADSAADIVATSTTVTASGAFGTALNAINTTVDSLTVDTSDADASQWIAESDGLTGFNLNAGSGDIVLTTGAAVSDTDVSTDIAANSVTIMVAGTVGSAVNSINTNVASLSVDTRDSDGSQWLTESNGLTALNLDAGTGNVVLNAGGTVADSDAAADIRATNASMTANGAFGASDHSINTAVDSLSVNTTSADGSQWIAESDSLMALTLTAGTGNITLTVGGFISDDDASNDIAATNAVLTVAGNVGTPIHLIDTAVDSLSVDTSDRHGSQSIAEADSLTALLLTAGTGDILLTTAGSITDADGTTDILAAGATITAGGVVGTSGSSLQTSVDSLTIDTSSDNGEQWLSEVNELTALNLNAGTGSITATTGGAVGDADGLTDIAANSATFVVTGTFGTSANAIHTTVNLLSVDTSSADGSQWTNESDGLTGLSLDAGTGDIVLSTGSSVTDADATTDVTANSITMTIAGTVGSALNPIATDVTLLTVDTSVSNGTQWLAETDNLTGLNLDAGTGHVVLSAGGTVTDGDAAADIRSTNANIVINGAFGASDHSINTAVDSLSVDTTAADGSQWIIESDSLTALALAAGTGDITLNAGGGHLRRRCVQ